MASSECRPGGRPDPAPAAPGKCGMPLGKGGTGGIEKTVKYLRNPLATIEIVGLIGENTHPARSLILAEMADEILINNEQGCGHRPTTLNLLKEEKHETAGRPRRSVYQSGASQYTATDRRVGHL